MKRVALALIDCDLYESTGQVLEFLEPLLDDGTVLLFDDWTAFDASDATGRRRAFREFLEAERWAAEPLLAYGHYGQVFAMRRKEPTAPPERGGVRVRLDYGRVEAGASGRMAGRQREPAVRSVSRSTGAATAAPRPSTTSAMANSSGCSRPAL